MPLSGETIDIVPNQQRRMPVSGQRALLELDDEEQRRPGLLDPRDAEVRSICRLSTHLEAQPR